METRRTKTPKPLSEAEIEEHQAQIRLKESQLREQTALFEQQRDEFLRERENSHRDLDTIRQRLADKELELSKRTDPAYDGDKSANLGVDALRQEFMNLRADLAQIKNPAHCDIPPTSQGNARYADANTSALYYPHGHDAWYDAPTPRVSFREALETVPNFDGQNISLAQFTRACRRAREIVPPSSERSLTRLLINKLRGRAYYAVEDEPCDTVTQLVDLLNGAFGAPKTIDQFRGELSTIYLKPHEHVLDYITRTKDLRTAILDTERRQRGTLNDGTIREIDGLTARAFCEGLPLEFRLQLNSNDHSQPFEAFSHVKILAKRRELDHERSEGPRNSVRTHIYRHEIHPVGRPLAHSTPNRYDGRYERDLGRSQRSGNIQHTGRERDQRRDDPRVNIRPSARPPIDRYRAEQLRRDRPFTENAPHRSGTPTQRDKKFCKYCKNAGHTLEECRKRQYNNERVNQGNAERPSRVTDEPRAGPSHAPSRPVKIIQGCTNDPQQPESQS